MLLVGGQVGSHIKKTALYANKQRALIVVSRQHGNQESDVRTQFVDSAIGLQPHTVLLNTYTTHQTGHAFIASTGVNLCHLHRLEVY